MTEPTTLAPVAALATPDYADLYELLAREFANVLHDKRNGTEFDYITGEQCTTRLNKTLGFMAWSFRILQHDINTDADEVWVLGELTVTMNDRTVVRQQFGSQKLKRKRSDSTILDIGFDLKGAATDALKKCASQVGVALYLSHKNGTDDEPPIEDDQPIACALCRKPLEPVGFQSGTVWDVDKLVEMANRLPEKYVRPLCYEDFKAATEEIRAAQPKPAAVAA